MNQMLMAILFTVCILSIATIVTVHAEEQEKVMFELEDNGNGTKITIYSPIQISEQNSGWCDIKRNVSGLQGTIQCLFLGLAPDGSERIWDREKEEWTSTIILEAEAKENYDALIEEQRASASPLAPTEKRIEYLKAKENPTPNDLEEIALLEQLGALCRNDTLVSQTYREFDVPTLIFRNFDGNMTEVLVEDKSIRTDNIRNNANIKELRMAVQECIGQPHTKKSAQYDHIVVDDIFSEQLDFTSQIPTWTQDRVNHESNFGLETTKENQMCTSHNSDSTKRDYGCEDLRVYPTGKGSPEQEPNWSEHPLLKARNELIAGNDKAQLEIVKKKNLEAYLRGHN